MSTLTIKTDEQLKKEAKKFFAGLGLNLSSAINLFLQDAVRNKRFTVSFKEKETILQPIDISDLSPHTQKELNMSIANTKENFVNFSLENIKE